MSYEAYAEIRPQERQTEGAAREHRIDRSYVADLIELLTLHPNGLRRWSVMRALRANRDDAGRDIPQKFEDDVERVFRRFCAGTESAKAAGQMSEEALFYRPKERAGEVWAVFQDRAQMWLKSERFGH